MNGLEAQISSIFRRFQREEMEFNCCCRIDTPVFFFENWKKKSVNCSCSIDSPVFLRWKWLKTHVFGICCVFQRKKSESIFVCTIDSVIICCWKCLCIWIYTSSIILWTGWKPRFHRFFEDFKERKWTLIVVAVSTPPLFFFENCKKKEF